MAARHGKLLTIVWALLLGTGIVALAGSILLPSTKRARVDWDQLRRIREQEEAAAAATQIIIRADGVWEARIEERDIVRISLNVASTVMDGALDVTYILRIYGMYQGKTEAEGTSHADNCSKMG